MRLLRLLLVTFLIIKEVNCREGNINDLNKGAWTTSVLDGRRYNPGAQTHTHTRKRDRERERGRVPLSESGAVPAAELFAESSALPRMFASPPLDSASILQ